MKKREKDERSEKRMILHIKRKKNRCIINSMYCIRLHFIVLFEFKKQTVKKKVHDSLQHIEKKRA
jgi:hypothetical protein